MIKIKIKNNNLTEATITDTANIAAFRTIDARHDVIILLDTNGFNPNNPKPNIIGCIKYIKAKDMKYGSCNDSYNITSSLVTQKYKSKGYGKLLYKLAAASVNKPIMPDRFDTSDDARNIWNSFRQSGEFKVEKLKDCAEVEPELDYSFKLNSGEVTKHLDLLNNFTSKLQLDPAKQKEILSIVTKLF